MADLAVWVRGCLQRLPPKHRQVVLLRFYADSSLEEIALALGCSRGTVKSRLFHALAKLRLMKDLGKECIEP
jgi:RNA polymerase sigma-70 factor (ECF subfamily)